MSPIKTTSNTPSSGRASGASHIAPPCHWPFATMTSCMRASRRDRAGPAEVHSGAGRAGRQLGRAARQYEPVHDLIQRSVAADRDDEGRAVADGLRRELDQLPGALREESLSCKAEPFRTVRQLRP